MSKLKSLFSKVPVFLNSIKLYPVEFCMTLFLFISVVIIFEAISIADDESKISPYANFFYSIWTFAVLPFITTIIIRCDWKNRTKSDIAKYAYWASGLLLLLPGFIFPKYKMSEEIIFGTYLLAFGLLISSGFYWDNRKYAYNGSQMFHQLCSSIIISGILVLAYYAVAGTITYLFLSSQSVEEYFIVRCLLLYGGLFIVIIFFPLLLTHKLSVVREQKEETISKVLDFCANYILIPFLIIYTVILYAYACEILILWNLPKGMVGWMVMGYIFLAFIGHALQRIISNKRFEPFFRYLPYISIVPLALFWVGLCRRLSDYGLTESRIYILTFGVSATLFMIFLLFKKTNHYLLMAGIVGAIIVFLAYIPWTNATRLAAFSQLSTVNKYVKKYDLLKDDQRHFKDFSDWCADATADTSEVLRFISAYEYLGKGYVEKKVENDIQYDSIYSIYGSIPNEIKEKYSKDRLGNYSYKTANEKRWIHHKKKSYPIDIKCYPFLCKLETYYGAIEGDKYGNFINIYDGDRMIFSINWEQHIRNNLTTLLQDSIPLEKEDQFFTFRNDSILIVMNEFHFTKEDDKLYSFTFEDMLIFSKYPLENVSIKSDNE